MTHRSCLRFASLLSLAVLGVSGVAHAQQYIYQDTGPAPQPVYSATPSTNYVSTNSQYRNPYQVPAANSNTSYQPVSVPGSGQYAPSTYQPAYQPAAAPQTAYYPAATPAGEYPAVQGGTGMTGLPSYPYNPDLDPQRNTSYQPPPATDYGSSSSPDSSTRAFGPYLGLQTRTGIELGGQWYWYEYAEPNFGVSETGGLGAIMAKGTFALESGYFGSAEIIYGFGDADYKGSGEQDNVGVEKWDLRALFGKDYLVGHEFSLSPFVGIAYRTLYNDNRGVSSTGNPGYQRYNRLWYIPLGVYPRAHIDSNARLAASLEYDFLLHGLQESHLSDAGLGDPDIKNNQSSGYGIRGEIMYETRTWSFGPTFTYWNIHQSNTVLATDNSAITCFDVGGPPCIIGVNEPANHTYEAGLQFRYHFF